MRFQDESPLLREATLRKRSQDVSPLKPAGLAQALQRIKSEGAFSSYDENTKHAIEYRLSRQKHSDFYVRLCLLQERIQVYKYLFMQKTPKFLIKRVSSETSSVKRNKSPAKSPLSRRKS